MNTATQTVGFWKSHGTKILGVLTALVGASGESLALIQAFDPKRAALWGLVIGIGAAVLKRGYTNTQTTEQTMLAKGWTPPPPPPGGT